MKKRRMKSQDQVRCALFLAVWVLQLNMSTGNQVKLPTCVRYSALLEGSIAENSWSHCLCLLLEADSKQTFCLSCFGFVIVFSYDVCPAEQKHARCSPQARAVCREEEPLAGCKVTNGRFMLTGTFLMEK